MGPLRSLSSPFGTEPIEEVALDRPPLVRVLAQVRFPPLSVLSIGDDAAHRIAMELSQDYPVFNEGREMVVTITPQGVQQQPGGGRTWQVQDAAGKWQVTFAPNFVTVHTSAYVSRNDFVARLNQVVHTFASATGPPRTERIGIRYINRLEEEDITDLATLVRPEMLGGLAAPHADYSVKVERALNEVLYNLAPKQVDVTDSLQARWGVLPSGAMIDPTLPGLSTSSWILDMDSFRTGSGAFTAAAVSSAALELADRAYRFFRWVVNDDFLMRFGARHELD